MERLRSWWLKLQKHIVAILVVAIILIAALTLIFIEIRIYGTGFRGKTLWDWLQLLIVPLVLAIIALVFQQANSRTERRIALDKQREDLLQTYLDRISELLLKDGLRTSPPDAEVRNVAHVRTLTVLSQLDTKRKNHVLAFLREANLVSPHKGESVITFENADFTNTDLRGVNLSSTYLSKARFENADLSNADLSLASLNDADLSKAILSGARLRKTWLEQAILHGTNLSKANLSNANLCGAMMNNETDLSETNLQGAKYNTVKIKRMDPQGKTYSIPPTQCPPGFDLKGAGAICVDV